MDSDAHWNEIVGSLKNTNQLSLTHIHIHTQQMNDTQSDSDQIPSLTFTISVGDDLDDNDNDDIDYGETVTPSIELLQQRQLYLLSQQGSSSSPSMATGSGSGGSCGSDNVNKSSERTLPSWMMNDERWTSSQKEDEKKKGKGKRKAEDEKNGSDDGVDGESHSNNKKKMMMMKMMKMKMKQDTTRNVASSSSSSSSASTMRSSGKNRDRRRDSSGASRLSRRGRNAMIESEDDENDDIPSSSEDDEYEEEVTESQFRKELQDIERKRRREKSKKTVPRSEILSGVTICISGIQNPERARIRQLAMGMGARYSGDWTQGCTHLICAIGNTPKLTDARRSNAWVVTKDWITACDRRKMRVPEKQYDFDSPQLELSDDDDDVYDYEELISEESGDESEEDEFNDGKFGEEDEDLHAHPEDEWVPPSERKKKKRSNSIRTPKVVLGFSDLSDEEEEEENSDQYDMMQNERRQKKQRMSNGGEGMETKGNAHPSIIESITTNTTGIYDELLDHIIITGDVANLLHSAEAISQTPAKLIRDIMTTALRHLLLHGSLDDRFLDNWNYNKVRVPKSLRKIIMQRPSSNTSMIVRPHIISLLKHAMLEELHSKGTTYRTFLDELPSVLEGLTIKLGNDVAANQEQWKLLNRIGNFLGAEVLEPGSNDGKTVTHIITSTVCPDQLNVSRFVQVVSPEWLEMCMLHRSYVDEEPFLIPSQ